MNDKEMYNIGRYGVPREYTACPGCGQQIGHHNTKGCLKCEQCSKCCTCKKPKIVPAEQLAAHLFDSF